MKSGKLKNRELEELTNQWLQIADLEKVVLFGSVARGEGTEDSDLDILVVLSDLPADEFKRIESDIYRAKSKIRNYSTPVDIIVVTSAFLQKKLKEQKGFYPRILKEGVEIYAKKVG